VTRPVYAARAALLDLPYTATPDDILAAVNDALAPHTTTSAAPDVADVAGQLVIDQVVTALNGGSLGRLSTDDVMRAIAGEHPIEDVVPDELPADDAAWLAKVAAAVGFEAHRPVTARWVITKVVGAWRAVAQDAAAQNLEADR
jgi:hypothetical protein